MAKIIGKADLLKRALAEIIGDVGLKEDEFTAQDLVDQRPELTRDQIRFQLDRDVASGKLAKRKITLNGTRTNAYRFVER